MKLDSGDDLQGKQNVAMERMRGVFRATARFVVVWFIEAISLLVLNWFVPGISFAGTELEGILPLALSIALVLAFLNVSIRAFLIWITMHYH